MHLFNCYFFMDFVCKMGARPGLAKEPLIPFNIQKMDFLPNRPSSSINEDFKRMCVQETTPLSMAASWFEYSTYQLRSGEFSLAQWLWYWLFVQASLVQVLSRSYISAIYLFFVTDFVHKSACYNNTVVYGHKSKPIHGVYPPILYILYIVNLSMFYSWPTSETFYSQPHNFSPFSKCFLPYPNQISVFGSHINCHQQNLSIWTSLKFFCFNPFTNKPCFLRVWGTSLLETLWRIRAIHN